MIKINKPNSVWVCHTAWGIIATKEEVEIGEEKVRYLRTLDLSDLMAYLHDMEEEYKREAYGEGFDRNYYNPLFNGLEMNPSIGKGLDEEYDRLEREKKRRKKWRGEKRRRGRRNHQEQINKSNNQFNIHKLFFFEDKILVINKF